MPLSDFRVVLRTCAILDRGPAPAPALAKRGESAGSIRSWNLREFEAGDVCSEWLAAFYWMVHPPSIMSVAPVINDACGEARKTTGAATSSGSPTRPSGIR